MDTGVSITCPKCGNKLPGWAQICQFCKADVRAVARPEPEKKKQYHFASLEPPRWILPTYTITLLILGLMQFLSGFLHMSAMQSGKGWVLTPVLMAVAYFTSLICFLALTRLEFVRGILNVICGVILVKAAIDGVLAFILVLGLPAAGLLSLIFAILDMAVAGFVMYLISETEKYQR